MDAFDEGQRLAAIREVLSDPRPVLNGVGALMVSHSRRAFRLGRFGDAAWPDRGETKMNPNWPGILQDLESGKTPPARRFQSRPVLVDVGTLAGSINWRVTSDDLLEVGTRLSYASVLHAGGESETVKITEALQQRLWDWIKRTKKAAPRAARKAEKAKGTEKEERAARSASVSASKAAGAAALGWLLNKALRGQRLTIRHPARPFVGLTPDIEGDVAEQFSVSVRKAVG